jgi:sporulation protein YlmC with PRC-barrel domain
MSVNMNDPAQLHGTTVVGGDGEKLGNVDAVYYDNATDRAEWVAVRSGLFGTRVTLVPLRRADYTGDELRVPFDKVQLRNAPHHDPGNELSFTDEADLYRYYGIDYSDSVRLAKETVTEQRTVEGDVRQERIEYDGAELDTAEHDLRDNRH